MTPEIIDAYKEFSGLFKYFPHGTKMYFLRHGQTDNNLNRIAQGARQTDVDLNRTGISQAHEIGHMLDMETFDFCYTSPAKRAKKTFEIVKKYFISEETQNTELKALQEIDWGSEIDGLPMSETEYQNLNDEWFSNKNYNHTVGDCETLLSVFERCAETIRFAAQDIAEKLESGKFQLPDEKLRPLKILFTGHGFHFGLLLTSLIDRKLQLSQKPSNGGCKILTVDSIEFQHKIETLK